MESTTIPGITKGHDSNGTLQFHSEKQFYTVPVIVRTYFDKDVKEGEAPVRMYECVGERHFIADTYDRNFKTTPGVVKPKGHRESSFNYTGSGQGSRR